MNYETIYGYLLLSLPYIAICGLFFLVFRNKYFNNVDAIRILQSRNEGLSSNIAKLKQENKLLRDKLENENGK